MKPLPIGLALSGGTARSVTHVGVIKALLEAGISFDYIAGTSGGSIVGAMLASGRTIPELEELAMNMSWKKLASIKITKLGFVSSKRIEALMQEFLGDVTFADLEIPFVVTTTNLTTGQPYLFNQGKIARAIRASCSIPHIFLPVEIDGTYYVDGGLSQYLPVESARHLGKQFTIAVHLGSRDEVYHRPAHLLQLIMQLNNLIARQNYQVSEKKADFIIRPDVSPFSAFDFANTPDLMEVGYNAAKQQVDAIRQAWFHKSSLWQRLLAKFNSNASKTP